MDDIKVKVKGVVKFAGTNRQDNVIKEVLTLAISEETETRIRELLGDVSAYDAIPLKEDDDGNIYFKASSAFDVTVYEKGNPVGIDFEEIGKDTTLMAFVKIKEVKGRKKNKFLVAYLHSVNIADFVEKVVFNPFVTDDIDEI